jgi:hypothetical protein
MLRTLLAAALLTLGFAAGCSDGDGDADPTATLLAPTAAPTEPPAEPTATLPPNPTPAGVVIPEAPALPPEAGITVHQQGTLDLTIAARGASEIDPLALVGDAEVPCAALSVGFSWQVQDPYPPEGVDLRITGVRMGAEVDLGDGAVGTSSVGCFALIFHNDSDFPIQVEVRYAAGSIDG